MFQKINNIIIIIIGMLFVRVVLGNSTALTRRSPNCKCSITLNNAASPMVVQRGIKKFIYPEVGQTYITFKGSVDLICPGKLVKFGSISYQDFVTATCKSGDILEIKRRFVKWRDISCNSTIAKTIRTKRNACEKYGTLVDIGFQVKSKFLSTMLICFDESKQEALYSLINIPPSINQRIKNIPRPGWSQERGIYAISNVNDYYTNTQQRISINIALGLPEYSTKYINNINHFLSRGHLTSRTDNFYPAQQIATFTFLNAAPQWQTCNRGNWLQVEVYVRDYAESHRVDLQVWTGVYGVTTLPREETGEAVPLYLYNKNGRKWLPVPELFWKVAYEPRSRKGIVFIVTNNPYHSTYTRICKDISDEVTGLKWTKNDTIKGILYVCTVESFRGVVTYLPYFNNTGLLK